MYTIDPRSQINHNNFVRYQYFMGKKNCVTNFYEKQDKYTMDPGRQIYLSNIKKKFGQNDFWTTRKTKFEKKILKIFFLI